MYSVSECVLANVAVGGEGFLHEVSCGRFVVGFCVLIVNVALHIVILNSLVEVLCGSLLLKTLIFFCTGSSRSLLWKSHLEVSY